MTRPPRALIAIDRLLAAIRPSAITPYVVLLIGVGLSACGNEARLTVAQGTGPAPELPQPENSLIPTVNIAPAKRWSDGQKPDPAKGLQVKAFARGLQHPRWLYVLPNGDVLVAESNGPKRPQNGTGISGWVEKKVMARAGARVPSPNKIVLLRDNDGDGVADVRRVFLDHLNSPFGMTLVGDNLYVADTDALLRFDYRRGQTHIDTPGEQVTPLPAGPINHHWTKNVIAGPEAKTLYVTVGSNSNIAENGITAERGRAAIWAVDRATGRHRLYATGLRNPVGMAFVPRPGGTQQLWTVVNERDELGSDLVPDYMTSVKDGGFYGWPYSYFGQHVDARVTPQKPELVARAIKPDYALGPHTASLGLAYSGANSLPARFHRGMFVGQHGSWNRKPRSGYKVIFVPFQNGQPVGAPIPVLRGFVSIEGKARGRPVGVVTANNGDLLVADDVGNAVWRVGAAPVQTAGR